MINAHGPWRDVNHVEVATFEWVDFFNTERSHEHLNDLTPALVEQLHYHHKPPSPGLGETNNRVSGNSGRSQIDRKHGLGVDCNGGVCAGALSRLGRRPVPRPRPNAPRWGKTRGRRPRRAAKLLGSVRTPGLSQ